MGHVEKFKLANGEVVDAERIEISQQSEYWNHYLLEDGTTLKLKPIASKVVRLVNQYDQSGNPVYFIHSRNVVDVDCPEKLRKAP